MWRGVGPYLRWDAPLIPQARPPPIETLQGKRNATQTRCQCIVLSCVSCIVYRVDIIIVMISSWDKLNYPMIFQLLLEFSVVWIMLPSPSHTNFQDYTLAFTLTSIFCHGIVFFVCE